MNQYTKNVFAVRRPPFSISIFYFYNYVFLFNFPNNYNLVNYFQLSKNAKCPSLN
jgi:hypothetical protein